MRLPIQSMHAVLLRRARAGDDAWLRSVVVDFVPEAELIVRLPELPAGRDSQMEGDARADRKPADEEKDDEIINPAAALFPRGTLVEVELSFPDGLRRFGSFVRGLDLRYGGALRIAWPTAGERIQRRDWVRVEAAYRATVRFMEGVPGTHRDLVGATMDISAGGVRLQLPEAIPDDARVEVSIEAGYLTAQTLQGRVVRSRAIERLSRSSTDFWVAVEFLGVDEALRNRITKLVFDIQREQKRKSLA